jgi:hypothetical protein
MKSNMKFYTGMAVITLGLFSYIYKKIKPRTNILNDKHKHEITMENCELVNGEYGYEIYIYTNGDVYDGNWKNYQRNGYGIYIYKNGDKYEGGWKDDKKNGNGKIIYVDGNCYEGEWKDDKKNGNGMFIFSNGNKYKGYWKNDIKIQPEEKSIIQNPDGDNYEGYMINMTMFGYCVITYKNGN